HARGKLDCDDRSRIDYAEDNDPWTRRLRFGCEDGFEAHARRSDFDAAHLLAPGIVQGSMRHARTVQALCVRSRIEVLGWHRRPAHPSSRYGLAGGAEAPEPSLTAMKVGDGEAQVVRAEVWPGRVEEAQLRVGRLPQQEVRKPLL